MSPNQYKIILIHFKSWSNNFIMAVYLMYTYMA